MSKTELAKWAAEKYPDPKLEDYEDILEYRNDRNWAIVVRNAVLEGYEQAEKDLGWISVKEKLPGSSEWVVACVEVDGICTCLALATYNEATKEWHTDSWEDGEQEVYHPDYWLPIPNKVREGEK